MLVTADIRYRRQDDDRGLSGIRVLLGTTDWGRAPFDWWARQLLGVMLDERVEFQENRTLAFRLRMGGHGRPDPSWWKVVAGRTSFGATGIADLGVRQFVARGPQHGDPSR